MCFSATASFVAGTALGAAGTATIRRAKAPAWKPFAAIPLLFGVQQLLEGIVWVTFGMPHLQVLAASGYLFFALVFWPAFVPYAVWRVEPDPRWKAILAWFAWFGAAIGLYLFSWLIQGQASVTFAGRGLAYDLPLPDVPGGLGAYVIARPAAAAWPPAGNSSASSAWPCSARSSWPTGPISKPSIRSGASSPLS